MTGEGTIRVGVNGAAGAMGRITVQALENRSHMETVFETDLGDDLAQAIKDSQAHVVVDFTVPDVVFPNTLAIIRAGARPVVGTTGLEGSQLTEIHQALLERDLGGIVAPNFSMGALLMMKLSELAAKHMEQCEIIELHHDRKIDAPSGTSLLTAEKIAAARPCPAPGREKEPCPSRGWSHAEVPIHSVRLPGLLAHQQVIFGSPGESLTIRHDTHSRTCFTPGILLAIREVLNIHGLQVGLPI
jgi:4-hydroxy-tetrahydrodipicolinate reductase